MGRLIGCLQHLRCLPNDPRPAGHPNSEYQDKNLRHARNNELTDRRSAAAEAKESLLTAYRAAKTAAEPLQAARQAERISLAEAREARRSERERLKHDERPRVETLAAQEQAAIEAAAVVEIEVRKSAENARISRVVQDEATRKAERDRRYAARKARQA